MKQPPHPDRSPEAAKVRDELSDQTTALRALDALARQEPNEEAIPPIPDELRDQWQDRYGHARQAVPQDKESWFRKTSQLWLYGGASALAAIAIFVVLRNDSPITPGSSDFPPTMRGGNDFEITTPNPIIFIPNHNISFEAFTATRSPNSTLEAKDNAQAVKILTDRKIKSASILDARNGTLTSWGGGTQTERDFIEITTTTDEYDLSEALDSFLNQ